LFPYYGPVMISLSMTHDEEDADEEAVGDL
jgi:hypothetical protein